MTLTASHWRLVAFYKLLLVRRSMAANAQIMKRALRPLFIALSVPRIAWIALAAVTDGAFHQHRYSARLRSLVMTSNTLGALFCPMRKLTIGVYVSLVVAVPEQDDAARSVEVQLDYARRIIGLYSVAIGLIRRGARQQTHRHCNRK
jgi:uncharacterized membrane protein YpjA